MAQLSPMMQQYFSIKEQHKEHILFFRLGDFYEMFFDDAKLVSKELELTLTGRDCGQEEKAPMCGVPHHSCEAYIARLIKKGYKVAICEQVEDPKIAKGVVKREVVRVITPGTLIEANMLDEGVNNYIASIYNTGISYGLAVGDISTGEVHLTFFEDRDNAKIKNEIARFSPSEIVFNEEFLSQKDVATFIKDKIACCGDCLDNMEYTETDPYIQAQNIFGAEALEHYNLKKDNSIALLALSGLLKYINKTQKNASKRFTTLVVYSENQYMNLDASARRNLELTETMLSKEKKGSLLWVIDKTKTPMGKRLLRSYIEKPLISPTTINKRLNAVDELYQNPIVRDNISEILNGIYDIERLMTRIVYSTSGPRELKSLEQTAEKLPVLKNTIKDCTSAFLKEVYEQIDILQDIKTLISISISDNPPITIKDGWVIKEGYNEELDKIRDLVKNSKSILADIENRERAETGIKNLKISYNKVFGYYIEITKSNLSQAPNHYIRKQTLANCERYITGELKDLEEQILNSGEKMANLEALLFEEIRTAVAANLERVSQTATAIARLDVYTCFATVAQLMNYVRPEVTLKDLIYVKEGRHPVVEAISSAPFVANDVYLNNKEEQIAIITGPNMSGKSTYMRQTALIVLMAQIGSFVPAKSAEIGVVDGIYTRVGASDDLSTGQSTFMVEMNEVAAILKNATDKSLLILDEIGRGTSTYDGMSIARAVIEYIADKKKLGAKTLFATHYHELIAMEDNFTSIKNYHIAAKKRDDDIIFLRKIVPGGTDDSYGIEVSKLAGIPQWIIKRAFEILKELESGNNTQVKPIRIKSQPVEEQSQISFTTQAEEEIIAVLKDLDINTITPIEALNKIYELKKLIK